MEYTKNNSSLHWTDYLKFRLLDGGIKGMTLDAIENMDTEDFLKACEYVDMKEHIQEASERDREQTPAGKKPPLQ